MFEQEIKLNQFMLAAFSQVMADRQSLIGTPVKTPEWLPVFGPGSSDNVENPDAYDAEDLVIKIKDGYTQLCQAACGADATALSEPHEVAFLEGSPLVTRGDLLSHLLTTHFAFHTAQLSAWRRAAGHAPLF